MRQINQAGLDLIKEFEGVRTDAYLDPVGILTVGVGHVVQPGDQIHLGEVIGMGRVDALLRSDLHIAETGVDRVIPNTDDVTSNMFSACVSLAFNIGVGAFQRSSVAKELQAHRPLIAADDFLLWDKAGGKVIGGLLRRRKAEKVLFLMPDDGNDEPTIPDAPEPESAPEAPPTPPAATSETVVTTQQSSSVITKIANDDTVKEIAKSGVTSIGTKVSGSLATGGFLAALDSFVQQHWAGLIFAAVLILLAVVVALFILWHKHTQQLEAARINSDRTRTDVRFD